MAELLHTKELSKHFGGLKAVDDVNMYIEKGEIIGVIGPNGAGKTTLFNLVCGFFKPTKGEIFFEGRPIHGLTPAMIAQLGIGRTFQVVRPFKNLTVLQNVIAACGHDFYSGFSFFGARKREHIKEAGRIIKDVGLEGYGRIAAGNLPLGFQRRLEIARALALRPTLLLLDEPTAGMSHEENRGLMRLIRDIRKNGATMMLVEHNMRVAMELSDRIYVLNYGAVIAEGAPKEIRSNPRVIEAYLGRE